MEEQEQQFSLDEMAALAGIVPEWVLRDYLFPVAHYVGYVERVNQHNVVDQLLDESSPSNTPLTVVVFKPLRKYLFFGEKRSKILVQESQDFSGVVQDDLLLGQYKGREVVEIYNWIDQRYKDQGREERRAIQRKKNKAIAKVRQRLAQGGGR